MKEYKTMRVHPDDEVDTIESLAVFGWKLEDSKEIYNESNEVVGVNVDTQLKVKEYGDGIVGGFLAGWRGDEGKCNVERKVTYETKKNVTHYVSLRFSRETTSANYQRLKELEEEYRSGAGCKPILASPDKPKIFTVFACIVLAIILISLCTLFFGETAEIWEIVVCVVVPVVIIPILVVRWVNYAKKSKAVDKENAEIREYNRKRMEAFERRSNEIVEECIRLNESNR